MKLFRTLSVNLGLPALVPLLLLVGACSSDSNDGPAPTAGSGGLGAGGVAGSGVAGSPVGGAASGAPSVAGSSPGGSAGAGAGAPSTAGAGAGGAAAGSGGTAAGGGGTGGSTGGAGGGAGSATGGTSGDGAGGTAGGPTGGTGGGNGMFALTSTAFENKEGCGPMAKDQCDIFPRKHTNFGTGSEKNVSPPFAWTGAPAGTQSFAIVMTDLSFNDTGHWAIWNIPASVSSLPEGLPSGAMLTTPVMANQTGLTGPSFFGSGACGNVYEFVIYALSQANVTASGNPAAVRTTIRALGDAILGQASLRARSAQPECN